MICTLQVWKQKGEEYRVVSGDGWLWLSATRHYQFVPMGSVGLRGAAKKLRERREKKEEEATEEGDKKSEAEEEKKDRKDGEMMETDANEDNEKGEESKETDKADYTRDKTEGDSETEMETSEKLPLPAMIDVSEALSKHTFYTKAPKPYSRLDSLLEKREKQYEIELKQKLAVEQIITRYKKQEEDRKKLLAAQQQTKDGAKEKKNEKGEESDDVDVVGDKQEEQTVAAVNGEITESEEKQSNEEVISGNSAALLRKAIKQRKIEEDQESIDADEETDEESIDEDELTVPDEPEDDAVSGNEDVEGNEVTAQEGVNEVIAPEAVEEGDGVDPEETVYETEVVGQDNNVAVNEATIPETIPEEGEGVIPAETFNEGNLDAANTEFIEPSSTSELESESGALLTQDYSTSVVNEATEAVESENMKEMPSGEYMEIPQVDGTGDEKVDSQTNAGPVTVGTPANANTATPKPNTVQRIIPIPKVIPPSNAVARPAAAAATKATTVAKQAAIATAANLLAIQNSAVGQAVHALIQGSKIQLTASAVADLESKLKLIGDTQQSCNLIKFKTRGGKQALSKYAKGKSLPTCQKFTIKKGGKKSLFILEKHDVRKLARKAGKKETPGFKYDCKMNNVNWAYPCPRPTFKTCWRWRTQNVLTLGAVAVQLRVLWASLRWDDLASKPPTGGTNTMTTETDITTTELLKRRDIGAFGLKSEYLVRKIVVPIGMPAAPKSKFKCNIYNFLRYIELKLHYSRVMLKATYI